MIPRLLACALTLLAALPWEALAEKPKPVRPRPADTTVEVMRGGSVRIALKARERNLNRLKYRTVGAPRHGRLSSVQQYNGPESQGPGYVIYTHGNDDDSTSDTFAFEATSTLTNLTGRGRVTVRIVDLPAQLQITPPTLDFGDIAVGDPPARMVVELANVGGGLLQGFLEPPAPFLLEGDGSFVLRRGEKVRVPLLFAPERPGPYTFPIQPVLGDAAILTLKGNALAPIAIIVASEQFTAQANQSRTARAVVENLSQEPHEVLVKLPPETPVKPVAPFIVAPGQSAEVLLRIPPDHKTHLPSFPVSFEAAGQTYLHSFTAPAIPAGLVVVAAPDFGDIAARGIPKASLVLRNDGGAVAEVRLQPHESITPADGAPTFRIEPGEEHVMELELRRKKDTSPPAPLVLLFRGEEIQVPVTAAIVPAGTPTPVVTPTPTPAPRETAQWALDTDIRCTTTPQGPAVRWTEKNGWTNVALQHRPAGSNAWTNYQLPAPHEGLLGWLQSLAGKIQGFLDKPIDRTTIEELSGEEEKFGEIPIATDAPGSDDLWRLQATSSASGESQTVSPAFRIEADRTLVAVDEQPAPAPTPAAAPAATPAPVALSRQRTLGPVTAIESAGIKSERRGATLQVVLAHDPSLRGFRLERGAMVSPVDPKTGIPGAPEFEPLAAPEAEVEILFFGEGEAEGRKLTVCAARIDGLPAGTRTYWRLVPAGPSGDLPPTTVLLVDTIPPPPFPWNKLLLATLVLLLAGVLYLRWKINRAPH